MKQNISSIFGPPGSSGSSDFNQQGTSTSGLGINSRKTSSGSGSNDVKSTNGVVDARFLEAHNAEVLCGPVMLHNCIDLTGSGGLITLSSPQLFSSKLRSLLLHVKGFENSPLSEPVLTSKDSADSERSAMTHMDKVVSVHRRFCQTG